MTITNTHITTISGHCSAFGNGVILYRGVIELRTVNDMGERGVKKQGKSGDVLYGRPSYKFTIVLAN